MSKGRIVHQHLDFTGSSQLHHIRHTMDVVFTTSIPSFGVKRNVCSSKLINASQRQKHIYLFCILLPIMQKVAYIKGLVSAVRSIDPLQASLKSAIHHKGHHMVTKSFCRFFFKKKRKKKNIQ